MPSYKVRIRKEVYLYATVEVEAETEGHACREGEMIATHPHRDTLEKYQSMCWGEDFSISKGRRQRISAISAERIIDKPEGD